MVVTATAKLQAKLGSSNFQRVNRQTSNAEEKHGLNFANANHLNHRRALEYARYILLKMRTNQDCRQRFWSDCSARKRLEIH